MKTIGKIIACASLFTIMLSLCGCPAITTQRTSSEDGFEYAFTNDKTAYIVYLDNLPDADSVVVPASFNGVPVVGIGGNIQDDKPSIRQISIPEGILSIGDYAFQGWTDLAIVNLPATLTVLSAYAFANCVSLAEIVVPEGVAVLEENLFDGCASLARISLPASLATVDEFVFRGCTSLSEFDLDPENDRLRFINGVLYDAALTTLIVYLAANKATAFAIPDHVETIGPGAFAGATRLTSITIPQSVTRIGRSAFRDCTGITAIEIPSGVYYLQDETFWGCTDLRTLTLNEGLGHIEMRFIAFCASLTTITIPASVIYISHSAFVDATALESIVVVSGNDIFESNDGVLYNSYNNTLVTYPMGKPDADFIVPGEVRIIAEGAFAHNTHLVNVTIAEGTVSIRLQAFHACSGLKKIVIPASVVELSTLVFSDCSDELVIYARREEAPSGWLERWNSGNLTVVWGYSG